MLGGVVGLDATSFPQLMLSRPLVAATLSGLLLGRPLEGALIGALLEAFALVILPIGAARYPEAGTAAVAATAAYAEAAPAMADAPYLLLAIVFALVWERLAGASVTQVRRLNERLVAGTAGRVRISSADLERRHLGAMGLDFLRGALVTAFGTLAALVLLRSLASLWAVGGAVTLGVLGAAGAAMVGAALPLFGGWSERRIAFMFGVLCGVVLLLVR